MTSKPVPGHLGQKNEHCSASRSTKSNSSKKMASLVQVVVQNLTTKISFPISHFFSPEPVPWSPGTKNGQFSTSCNTESHSQNFLPNFPFFPPEPAPGHLGQKNGQFSTSCSTESDGRNWG